MSGLEHSRLRGLTAAWLHLGVLWSFAFAQPLLDLLGGAPEFFVARENTRGDILLLAFGVTLLPPLVLVAIEAVAAAFSRRLGRIVHVFFVGALAAAFAMGLLNELVGAVLIPLAFAFGGLAALAYVRTRAAPLVLTLLAPAPLVFLLIFLVLSPVSKLVLPSGDVELSQTAIPDRPPIVVLVFDELSGFSLMDEDGRINRARYPNFARLASDATWYRNATTVADYTDRALPALLTGDNPTEGAAPIAADHPESLFTLLGGRYSFDVTEPVTDVCPERLCPTELSARLPATRRLRDLAEDLSVVSLHLLLPDALAGDLPPVDRSFGDFRRVDATADVTDEPPSAAAERGFAALEAVVERVDEFRGFARGLGRTDDGRLSFLHLQVPHSPYHFLPSGQRYPETLVETPGLEEAGVPGGVWGANRRLARQGFERYLLQSGYADRLLGRALDRLRASGRYDRSLVVVAADHGVSFQPGEPRRAITHGNLAEIAGIPLFVKAPGQHTGRVNDSNVRITDLLPTMASRLGVQLPWPTDGGTAEMRPANGKVTVHERPGEGVVSASFADYVRRRDALVERMLADLGRTNGQVFRGGPEAALIGSSVATLSESRPGEGRFELDGSGLLASVDPGAAVVPSFITGRVYGVPAGARLAIAVNGRVAAVTRPFDDGDLRRFSALVAPSSFAPGANTVELLAVTGTGANRRFERLRGVSLSYRIAGSGERTRLIDDSGRQIPVSPSAAAGAVETLTFDEPEIRIQGWASDPERTAPAERVIAFLGDSFVAAGPPSLPRDDLSKRFGSELSQAGFRLSGWAPGARVRGAEDEVRVFAIVDGRASELRRAGQP